MSVGRPAPEFYTFSSRGLTFAAMEKDNYTQVLEYFVREDSSSSEASDVTAHVPRYIPRNVRAMAGSANHDVLFVLSEDVPRRLYVYKFYWQSEDEKAQSSWSYWELQGQDTDKILALATLDSFLYLLVARSGGTYIERVPLDVAAVGSVEAGRQIYLDRRAVVSGVYDAGTGKTTFTLPYTPGERSAIRLVRGPAFSGQGLALIPPASYVWASGNQIGVNGNVTGCLRAFCIMIRRVTPQERG